MKTRIISGLVGAAIAIVVFCFMDTPVLAIALTLLAGLAVYEIEHVVGLKNKAIMGVSIAFGALIPLYTEFAPALADLGVNIPVTAVVILYVVVIFIMMLKDFERTSFETVAAVFVASLMVPWAFSTMLRLRDLYIVYPNHYDKYHSLYFILFPLFCAWLSDTFAYFSGRFFGKHKLCPKISPKKTVEGAIGGLVGAVVSCVILFTVYDKFFFTVHTITYIEVILLSALLSVVSVCGDLSASVIKRNFGAKDFGKIMPGHGGVMDRFDSALFVLVTYYAMMTIIRTVF